MTTIHSTDPVFSIITPTFKRPELLVRNIKSVREQTFCSYEHIIVDDGNDPSTDLMVESLIDARIVLIKHNQPVGAAAAYNSGIRVARGEYLTFLDDDDEYTPAFLERMRESFLKDGNNCGFIWSGIERVMDTTSGEIILSRLVWPAVFSDKVKGLIAATSIGNGYGLCIKKNCIDGIGYYDENLKVAEDTDFLIRLSQKYEFQTIPEVLVRIHKHEYNQLTRNENLNERIQGKETILMRYNSYFAQYHGLYIEHNKEYASLCYKSGFKKKGRKALFSILKIAPARLYSYLDFFSLELSGKIFSETSCHKFLKRLIFT